MFRGRATRIAGRCFQQKRNAGGPREPRNPNAPGINGYVNYVFREDAQLSFAIACLWLYIGQLVVWYYPYPDYLPPVMPLPGEVPKIREERLWDWLCEHDDNFEKFCNNNT